MDAMNITRFNSVLLGTSLFLMTGWLLLTFTKRTVEPDSQTQGAIAQAGNWDSLSGETSADPQIVKAVFHDERQTARRGDVIQDSNIQLCAYGNCRRCEAQPCGCGQSHAVAAPQVMPAGYAGPAPTAAPQGHRHMAGVNEYTRSGRGEPKWRDAEMIPWEAFAYGEYIGPHRTPHVPQYRLRVNDQLEFVYILTREKSNEAYRFYVGDQISIASAIDSSINVPTITIQNDGTVSLTLIGLVRVAGKTIVDLQRELNDRYAKFFQNPSVVVQVIQGDTPLQDLLNSVDARAGQGGQSRNATVSPDGTIQLPLIGSVPAIGLSLQEIEREVNARYRLRMGGISVTPVLTERAPRFIYVVGEVDTPGRFELTGPTSAMQALALAGGDNASGNLRQIIVFRRDENWRLTATKLDLAGAIYGRRPYPSDEIWLRDSDIVLIPKKPIQRFSDQVNLYLATTLYAIFPQQGVAFNFDDFTSL